MNSLKTKGIILKSNNVGDADKIVKILTPDRGVIDVSVKGARKMRSQFAATSQVFSFCDCVLAEGRNMYFLRSCETIESFSELVYDAEKLSYAAHFANLIVSVVPEGVSAIEPLYLILQALFELIRGRISNRLICRIFELKLACVAGYMPNLEPDKEDGTKFVFAEEVLLPGAEKAIRYVSETASKNVFSFGVNEEVMKQLDRVVPRYINLVFDGYEDVDKYLGMLYNN